MIGILQDEFANYLLSVTKKENATDKLSSIELEYYLIFHAAGLCQILVHWIENGFRETHNELAQMVGNILTVRI